MHDVPPIIRVPPVVATPAVLRYQTPGEYLAPPGWTDVEVFTLDPQRKQEFILLTVLVQASIRACAAIVVIAFGLYSFRAEPPRTRNQIILIECLILAALSAVAMVRQIWRTNRSWTVFRLLLGREGFVMRTYDKPLLTAPVDDIKTIVETWDTFRVTLNNGRFVILPKRVAEVDRLRTRLSQWKTIAQGWGRIGIFGQIIWTISLSMLVVIAYGVGLRTQNPLHLGICLAVAVIGSAVLIRRLWLGISTALWTRILGIAVYILLCTALAWHWLTIFLNPAP